jgi:CheY-like chemotaxis protein
VEDDASVRVISARLLRWRGHAVTVAASGVEGLIRCREAMEGGMPFDVLVTDVIMPEMGGRELVRQARLEQPSLAVVYCSGYVGDARADLELDAAAELVQKPFTSDALEQAITRTLERVRATRQG